MKRLTDKEWITTKHFQKLNAEEVLRRLWELENGFDSGKYIELPCKLGEKVYYIEGHVDGVFYWETVGKGEFGYQHIGSWGKSVFATKEEAEAKLKELRGKRNERL